MSALPATRCLVVAKAPVPGAVKTRLGADVGSEVAADLAAAALLDTLAACEAAFPDSRDRLSAVAGRRFLALDGDLGAAARGAEIAARLQGWNVFAQSGDGFADRLAAAHLAVAAAGPGPVVQVAMDTPHASADQLAAIGRRAREVDAVLGLARDGGWWVLGLRDPRHGAFLRGLPMSTAETGARTREALVAAGLSVDDAPVLRDVDTLADAHAIAELAPATRFAAAWSGLVTAGAR